MAIWDDGTGWEHNGQQLLAKWWLDSDRFSVGHDERGFFVAEDEAAGGYGEVIAGPFDTLDQAKVAYLMHRSTT